MIGRVQFTYSPLRTGKYVIDTLIQNRSIPLRDSNGQLLSYQPFNHQNKEIGTDQLLNTANVENEHELICTESIGGIVVPAPPDMYYECRRLAEAICGNKEAVLMVIKERDRQRREILEQRDTLTRKVEEKELYLKQLKQALTEKMEQKVEEKEFEMKRLRQMMTEKMDEKEQRIKKLEQIIDRKNSAGAIVILAQVVTGLGITLLMTNFPISFLLLFFGVLFSIIGFYHSTRKNIDFVIKK